VIKAVVDANVIISAVIARLGSPRRVYDAWREGAAQQAELAAD